MEAKALVGRRIRSLRKVRGLSQEQLAERAEMGSKYLSRIETGQENPTLDIFLRLSHGLAVDPYELLQFEHEGERSRQLRKKLERLIGEVKEENLARIVRVLEALVH
jgi:transcriptional regulator with XRE-family HTH domain